MLVVVGCWGFWGCGGQPAASEAPGPCCEVVVAPVESGQIRGKTSPDPGSIEAVALLRGAPSVPPLQARIDERGRFFFGPVPPGSYELVIEDPEGERLGSERVRVSDGAVIELRVDLASDGDGEPAGVR